MYGRLLAWWTPQTKRLLLITFVATAAFTALAHGFLFANEFFSSDSITLMYYRGFAYYLRNGRFLIPLYEYWKGDAAAPWLIGALFLCWMTLASYVTIHLFDIQSVSRQILLCGLLCTNWSLTLTGATYVYCMDEYAFALLLSITASFFLLREGMRNFLMGLFLLVVSLSIYQVYAWTYNMKDYLTKYLNYPILVDNETDVSQWEAVRKMPLFPEDGSVAMINGTLVIKISEIEDKT